MTIDMTNNRVPYGLLTDEEKAALHEHEKAGGDMEFWCGIWEKLDTPSFLNGMIYRTASLPKTQDVIAWDRLPDRIEWVARDEDGAVHGSGVEPKEEYDWWNNIEIRIDEFPGIVQIGTCDWKDSKQRRPRG
jgi:hypothetical protein